MVASKSAFAFASDNCSGLAPEALDALIQANAGYEASYGDDPWTQRLQDLVQDFFSTDCQVFLTFNGTAANALALTALVRSYQSVLCHRFAHIQTDECSCPEFFSGGTKLLPVEGPLGKIDLQLADQVARYQRGVHFPPVRALSITQATELGTVYTPEEMKEVAEFCGRHQLHLHVDGARFANALATLKCDPAEITWKAGVTCMTLGGTKNGMGVGECVVFFNRDLATEFAFRIKQAGQLASKMRFLTAPWVGMLESGAYLRRAADANRAAQRLIAGLRSLPGVRLEYPVEANGVFVQFPDNVTEGLHAKGWHFYDLVGNGQARLMCSWATSDEEVDSFLADASALVYRLQPAKS